MLASTKRRQMMKEGPPNKIAGFLYVWIGIVALLLAAFVLTFEGQLGPVSNFRIGLGVVIILWGVYRIVTGIMTVRKATLYKPPVVIEGKEVAASDSKPTA